ncbi:cyanase [Acidihalobacter ferrooxydans]|uniref:Cyanate hydratase n=1 Tax=Acidihalobacter ferrooxydans TaxID=1765967 RepID=A0A1P8UD60_9GAMM|nr:cyanase [Acidihalobacter ferrooxydans]APZ41770.1 cyanase [Acidihalobacter ferrooxydans]
MTREDVTAAILEARRTRGVSWAQLAQAVGRHPVWTTSALLGQQSMSEDEATAAVALLGLDPACVAVLTECPLKGSDADIPTDPLIYRLHEITQVYGSTIKALIHEEFGDGIMSAIDFELDIERVPDPKGDRVKITYNGKFLPYRKW